jgi:hypothetical protein
MTFGEIYNANFDSFEQLLTYRLKIYKKDYTGGLSQIILSGNPVIHEWQDDDPKAPIKGSTLKVSILTDESGIQLTDFYSEDDYGFACEFIRKETDEVLFQGYLLQDDSTELQVDFTHEIQLTFTDGLGLLKGVTLGQAAVITGVPTTYSSVTVESYVPSFASTIKSSNAVFSQLRPGDEFTITSGGFIGTHTVIGINFLSGVYYIHTNNNNFIITASYTTSVIITIPYPLTGYIPLLDIYKLCLKATYIDTGLYFYSRLYPVGGTNERLLDDTFIQAETYLKNGDWMDCYTILEQINSRFNISLFQAHGTWVAVRWDELYRYTTDSGATLQYHTYSNNFVYTATSTQPDAWIFRDGSDMEVGVLKSVNRANQFVRETFDYVQPESLLCNYDMQDLGAIIQEYNTGLVTIRDYVLSSWFNGAYSPYPDRFIRITFDNDPTSETYLQEISREIVISGNSGSQPLSAKSCDIPISKGDGIEYNFKYRTSNSEPGPVNNVFIITLNDGTTTYLLNNDGSWSPSGGFTYSIVSGDNANIYHEVTIKSNALPVSGIINIYLTQASSSLDQTFYKDLVFTINYFINKSNRIIGHTHTDSQSNQIKNNINKDIFIDDVPRTSITGALYLESYTALLRDLTVRWQYPSASYTFARLGQGTTEESFFTNYKMRSKYEGKLLYINQDDLMLTPLAVFKDNIFNGFRFVSGKMTIDYKNAQADLSLVELLDSADFEPGGAGITFAFLAFANSKLYEFNYLYEKY